MQATGDPYYLRVGQSIVEKLNAYARVPCGFAAVQDVRTGTHEDRYANDFTSHMFTLTCFFRFRKGRVTFRRCGLVKPQNLEISLMNV